MSAWHQIASATTTIAFSVCLLLASQMYVTSRVSAAESATLHVLKLRNAGYRALHGHWAGMPLAISLIVDGYVQLRDRKALETLRAHRVEMLESTRAVAELDITRMIATLNADIEIIDAGLSRLNALREEPKLAPLGSEATPPDDS